MPPTENIRPPLPPQHPSILEVKGLRDYKEAIEMAYQILLRQLCKNKEDVFETIDKLKTQPTTDGQTAHNRYRITLDLSEQRDFIVLTLVDGKRHEFSRARFLEKRRIKSDLINYYKPMGLFVRPPSKVVNSDIWNIDLLFRMDLPVNNEGTVIKDVVTVDNTSEPKCEEVIEDYMEDE
tara:strand:- start:9122 stop:9658 length:537 start_codon:yes stop_codon:yes gene_type:complete